jgi:hypothetical protein
MLGAHVENDPLDLALFDLDRGERISRGILELPPLDLFGGYDLSTLRNLDQSLG